MRLKCRLPVAGTTIPGMPPDTLEAEGIGEAVAVTGFVAGLVDGLESPARADPGDDRGQGAL